MVKYGPTGGDWKAYSVHRRKRCPKFCLCTYLKGPCSCHAFVHTANTCSHILRQLQLKTIISTKLLDVRTPSSLHICSLLGVKPKLQGLVSGNPLPKSYSFIPVSYLRLHNSASCTTFDLFALQTVADHLQCSFLYRTAVFSLASLSTMASLYSTVWPQKHSHTKENICHALYFGKTNWMIHFHDMILQ